MKELGNKKVIIGIGNSARQDDGLGWAFMDFVKQQNTNYDLEYRYQLQIEDAEFLTNYDQVIFVDATREVSPDGYSFKTCKPSEKYNFSTHALTPETILHLAQKLYNHNIDAFVLAIEGYCWELEIGLSEKGAENLNRAKKYFKDKILSKQLLEIKR